MRTPGGFAWHQGVFRYWTLSIQCWLGWTMHSNGVNSLKIWTRSLQWGDEMKAGDQGEGAQGCLSERPVSKVTCWWTWVDPSAPHQLWRCELCGLCWRTRELLLKDTIHILMVSLEEHFNRHWNRASRMLDCGCPENDRQDQPLTVFMCLVTCTWGL